MSSLTEIFSKFFSRLKLSKQKKLETDCLLFTKLFNEQLLKDLQETIKVYAQNHIKNFDLDQDYQELKKKHNKNNLFVDKKFPTVDSTVFYTDEYKNWLIDQNCLSSQNHVIWRRAKNINKNAKMASTNNNEFKYSYDTSDLNQGYVGDCWFVAAATGIIENEDLFKKIVPMDNSFSDEDYCGLFHFRFWIYGTWYDVCIDDYLPVGPNGDLNFCHNKVCKSEFWCALLEKAYAKVNGSYEALEGGFTTDALVDMSGGVEEKFNLKEIKYKQINEIDSLWLILTQAKKKKSVICCNLEPDELVTDFQMSNGLVKGHAYVVTTLANVTTSQNKKFRLLKCHNPWGNEIEFKGHWSKNSSIWNILSINNRNKLLNQVKKPGQFCWHCYTFNSSWILNENAGGRGYPNEKNYWTNPQFLLIITELDIIAKEGYATLIISLLQEINRTKKLMRQSNSTEEYIQYRIYKIKNKKALLECLSSGEQIDKKHLDFINSSGPYINKREIVKRINLKPGEYIIIPSTYDQDIELAFLLRVFSEKPLTATENDIGNDSEFENLKKFFIYINELLEKHGFPSDLKPNELESKSNTNLKTINSYTILK